LILSIFAEKWSKAFASALLLRTYGTGFVMNFAQVDAGQ
jgi:hypothetical protein